MAFMERWTQVSFHFRDDDGSETGATFKGAKNSTQTLAVDTTFRVRISIQASHIGTGSADFTGGFEYNNTTKVTGWTAITTTSSHIKAVASADTSWTITDDDATTEQLNESLTFVAGHMDETGTCSAVSLSETQESEFELVFQVVSADVDNNDSISIRMVDSGAALTTYTQTAVLTVSEGGGIDAGVAGFMSLARGNQ